MLEYLSLITFLWLTLWALMALHMVARGSHHSVLFVILLHFALCGLPLLLDVVIAKPVYMTETGFHLASNDRPTQIIYCLYVGIVPVLLWLFGRSVSTASHFGRSSDDIDKSVVRLRPIFLLLLLSPVVALLFAPTPGLYLIYGAASHPLVGRTLLGDYHQIVAVASVLAVLAGAGIAYSSRRVLRSLVFMWPLFFLALWVNGKRYIVAIAFVLVGYVLWSRNCLRGWRLPVAAAASLAVFAAFSLLYQSGIRGIRAGPEGFTDNFIYRNVRVDYGRDDVIKMSIFAQLYPNEIKILDHRGQSLLFYATMFVPRSLWPDKPLPYNHYFTSALFIRYPRMLSSLMTTSWLDESISNFGWLGIVLGPVLLALFCRVGDSTGNSLIGILTALNASLLLAVHMMAFAPLFFLWLALTTWAHFKHRVLPALSSGSPARAFTP